MWETEVKSLLIVLWEISHLVRTQWEVGVRDRIGKRGLDNHRRDRVLTREARKDVCG